MFKKKCVHLGKAVKVHFSQNLQQGWNLALNKRIHREIAAIFVVCVVHSITSCSAIDFKRCQPAVFSHSTFILLDWFIGKPALNGIARFFNFKGVMEQRVKCLLYVYLILLPSFI